MEHNNLPIKDFINLDEFKIPLPEALPTAILQLKKEKQAQLLAIIGLPEEVRAVADFCGTAEEILANASVLEAQVLVVNGDSTLAEAVKLLCPDRKILLPAAVIEELTLEKIYLCLKYELPIIL